MNSETEWSVTVRGNVCTIDVTGRFDFNRHPIFRKATEAALAHKEAREYLVDLRHAVYLDSSALGMLLNFNDAAQARGAVVVLANPGGVVQLILDVANFGKLFEIR